VVDRPWKELDQSMPLPPKAGSLGPPLTVWEKAGEGASGMAPMPWGRAYGADGTGLIWDSAKGVLAFLEAGVGALGFAAGLLLLLLGRLAVFVLVVAGRLKGVCVGAGVDVLVLVLVLVVAALLAWNRSAGAGSAVAARRRPRLPLSLSGRAADDIIRVMAEGKRLGFWETGDARRGGRRCGKRELFGRLS
jgi:hypothetical protein